MFGVRLCAGFRFFWFLSRVGFFYWFRLFFGFKVFRFNISVDIGFSRVLVVFLCCLLRMEV